MNRSSEIEASLAGWRAAERDLATNDDGDGAAIRRQLELHRREFQRLTSEEMLQSIGNLREAEGRRSHATPSTPAYHRAAQDAEVIAGDIWEVARQNDRDTPNRGGGGSTKRSAKG